MQQGPSTPLTYPRSCKTCFSRIPVFGGNSSHEQIHFLDLNIYQYIVPPFGYTSSPKLFTRILKPIITHLRTLGFQVFFYLDDSWHETDTYKESLRIYITTFSVLQLCGFVPNLRKLNLKLTQTLEILGAIVDSIKMCVWLPKNKEVATLELLSTTLALKNMSIRHLARVIGKFISCTIACPLGNAYFRSFVCLKVCTLNRNEWNWNSKVILNADSKMELNWWLKNPANAQVPIIRSAPTKTVSSDACCYGWVWCMAI